VGAVRQERGDEHGGSDLVRERLRGERDAHAAEAVADQDGPLAVRERGEGVQQRARVVLEGGRVAEPARVGARRGEVERVHAVARGAEQRGDAVPAPPAVARAVNEDDALRAIRRQRLFAATERHAVWLCLPARCWRRDVPQLGHLCRTLSRVGASRLTRGWLARKPRARALSRQGAAAWKRVRLQVPVQ
jgi:hypothetical protein